MGTLSYAHGLAPSFIERITGEKIIDRTHSIKRPSTADEGDPRNLARTFATFPEWYIVYSAQEYGQFLQSGGRPSNFPFFDAIEQYQMVEEKAIRAAGGWEQIDTTTQTVLTTIHWSYILEMAVIGTYEKTFGWITELLNFSYQTTEDIYIATVAEEYGAFLTHTPWYEFPYDDTLIGLWSTYGWSSITPRGLERRISYTIGYTLKLVYANIIGYISNTTFGGAHLMTALEVSPVYAERMQDMPIINPIAHYETHISIEAPRYRKLLHVLYELSERDIPIQDIHGHTTISFSIVVHPTVKSCVLRVTAGTSTLLYTHPILIGKPQDWKLFANIQRHYTHPYSLGDFSERMIFFAPVNTLTQTLSQLLETCGVTIEHVYDY
ncbi:MAG: hypothetical protein RI911_323 [Candidatus Parcubacteria bacterium]|jgi:hypothetical protein